MKSRLLVVHDNDFTGYYEAATDEQLQESALEILERRLEWDYYNPPADQVPYMTEDERAAWELTEVEINNMPPPYARRVLQQRANIERRYKEMEEDRAFYARAQTALENRDGAAALKILWERSDKGYQYETMELVP